MSLRYTGPADVTTPSISIYSGNPDTSTGGVERTFTSLAATNFGFVPKWMVLTGGSSWTGFANEDFSGNSTCFTGSGLMHQVILNQIERRSVIKGCDAKYRSVYYEAE